MQENWIALIISCLALRVSVASMLLPVKEWLHYWFPRLWPPSDQIDERHLANLESGGVIRTEAAGSAPVTLASLNQRVAQLEAEASFVGRVQTLDPPTPSDLDGARAVQRAG
ncbi:hypothetical protein N7510_005979 [Penicillium lagena]|uniref:uncharacterized protein n=1 Tax=Penicillium lagena TaxID=94218 RepID=UPI002541BBD6|nr:uncharacterized protein N7510_005979 [Penicillium lagena]KAJ5612785.1 hypothetical protein N7510_005979 [Penicillium lagena]